MKRKRISTFLKELDKRKLLYRPRSPWTISAAITYFVGAAGAFAVLSIQYDQGASANDLLSTMNVFLVIGLLLNGLGQLMRGAAHNSKSVWGKRIDGYGKLAGLLGWSSGLNAALFAGLTKINERDPLLFIAVLAVMIPPVITIAAAVLTPPAVRKEQRA